MNNDKIIKKIDDILSYHYHFSDFEFQRGFDKNGDKCNRPDKREWLIELYKLKMNNLKDFLSTNENIAAIEIFLLEEVSTLDSKLFLKNEFELLIGKYNEIPKWMLNTNVISNYLEQNIDKLNFID